MSGHIETQKLFFQFKALFNRSRRRIGKIERGSPHSGRGGRKERSLVFRGTHVLTLVTEQSIDIRKKYTSLTEFIQRTRLDEGFQRFFIEISIRNACEEIRDILKRPVFFTGRDYGICDTGAEILYRVEAETYGSVIGHRECSQTFIDRRGQYRDAHSSALAYRFANLVHVAGVGSEERRHVINGEVCLHIRRFVCEIAVAHCMGAVEAVCGECFYLLP